MSYRRVPALANPGILIRPAGDADEVRLANQLVFRNYVAEGYWDDDPEILAQNKWLHSARRDAFVAVYGSEVIGTVSIIRDSQAGLPSDSFQPQWLRYFRHSGERLAEVSALAVDRNHPLSKNLMFYLMHCYMQYSFYHTSVTRLIKACRPKHANFYADVLRFDKIGDIVYNGYARTPAQFLSMNLFDAHQVLRDYYESGREAGRDSFYRFLLADPHPNVRFPASAPAHRPRQRDWVAYARRRQTINYNWRMAGAGQLGSVAGAAV